ncbi:phosphatase PAP2 family protein [Alteromonas sp. SM 2104]|nr:phosphatase PAP2 family protein [Alteromonas oceanisediminis]
MLRDTWQLMAFFTIALAGWGFIELAALVTAETTLTIDNRVVLMFRNEYDLSDPLGPHWVEELMRDITALGGVGILVLVTLASTLALVLVRKPKAAAMVIIGIATGMALSFSLKYGFSRPRPELVPHGSYVYTSSFPSGHAMMSALVYFTIAGLLAVQQTARRMRTFCFAIAALLTISIGISRVYLGVHYPSDVVAGWLVGCAWALLIYIIYRWRQLKKLRKLVNPQALSLEIGKHR